MESGENSVEEGYKSVHLTCKCSHWYRNPQTFAKSLTWVSLLNCGVTYAVSCGTWRYVVTKVTQRAATQPIRRETSMSILLIVKPKYTLAASYAAAWRVTVNMPTGQTDRRTPDHYITLSVRRGRCNKFYTGERCVSYRTAEFSVYMRLNVECGVAPFARQLCGNETTTERCCIIKYKCCWENNGLPHCYQRGEYTSIQRSLIAATKPILYSCGCITLDVNTY